MIITFCRHFLCGNPISFRKQKLSRFILKFWGKFAFHKHNFSFKSDKALLYPSISAVSSGEQAYLGFFDPSISFSNASLTLLSKIEANLLKGSICSKGNNSLTDKRTTSFMQGLHLLCSSSSQLSF